MPEHKSGDEIERVFKVRHIPENIEKYPHENIVQSTQENRRVRSCDATCNWLKEGQSIPDHVLCESA